MDPTILKSFTVTKGDLFCAAPFIKNTYIAGGTSTGTVMLFPYSPETRSRRLIGHTQPVTCMCVSTNPVCLATGSEDTTVRFWQIRGNDDPCITIQPNDGPIRAIAISPNADRLLIVGGLSNPQIWDPFDKSVIAQLEHQDTDINAVALNVKSSVAITGAADGKCRIYDSTSGAFLRSVDCYSSITSLSMNDDGTVIAIGTAIGNAYLVDVKTAQILHSSRLHNQDITSLMIQPSGSLLLSGSTDSTVIISDINTFEPIFTLGIHKDKVIDVRFSNDGQQFTTCSADRKILLWNSPDMTVSFESSQPGEEEEEEAMDDIPAQKAPPVPEPQYGDRQSQKSAGTFSQYLQNPSPVKRLSQGDQSHRSQASTIYNISPGPHNLSDLSEPSTSSVRGQFGMLIRPHQKKKKQDKNKDGDQNQDSSTEKAKLKSKHAISTIKAKPSFNQSTPFEDEYNMLLKQCSDELNNLATIIIDIQQKLKYHDERIARIEAVKVARDEIARKKAARRVVKK